MKRLVVIAEKEELKLVEQLGYKDYPTLITGVGALNIIEGLKDIPKDVSIINIGYAGSKNLEPGKFYAIDVVSLYHQNVKYIEPSYSLGYNPWVGGGEPLTHVNCLTGTDFILESNLKGCVFDMELAYIMVLGFKDVIAYKYVSDNLDLHEYREKLNEE